MQLPSLESTCGHSPATCAGDPDAVHMWLLWTSGEGMEVLLPPLLPFKENENEPEKENEVQGLRATSTPQKGEENQKQ